MTTKYLPVLAILAGLAVCACATTSKQSDSSLTYLESAKQNYEEGEKALADNHTEDAINYFEHVRTKYPYSQYAALSSLKIADAYFADESWLNAALAYRNFLRFHPRHELAAQAAFGVAKSYFNAMPKDYFWLPKSSVKDTRSAREALDAINTYVTQFPQDKHVEEAKADQTSILERLAEHDFYAAAFYAKREKWKGAISRFERIASQYPDLETSAKALLEAAQIAKDKLRDEDKFKSLVDQIVTRYPKSPTAELAKKLLAS